MYLPTGPKKFEILVGERRYRHNHSQIIQAEEPCIQNFPVGEQPASQTTRTVMHPTSKPQWPLERPHLYQVLQDLKKDESHKHG